jgi:anti-anti-sigma factor
MACAVTTRSEGETEVLEFDGAIDTVAAQQIAPRVKEAFLGGAKKLVFDLSRVSYVASQGLGMFVTAVQSFPGKVIFAAPQPYVRQTLKLAQFEKIATLTKTVDEALAS